MNRRAEPDRPIGFCYGCPALERAPRRWQDDAWLAGCLVCGLLVIGAAAYGSFVYGKSRSAIPPQTVYFRDEVADIKPGKSARFVTPRGDTLVVTHRKRGW